MNDPVEDLLVRARELSRKEGETEASPDAVMAFLTDARARIVPPVADVEEASAEEEVTPEPEAVEEVAPAPEVTKPAPKVKAAPAVKAPAGPKEKSNKVAVVEAPEKAPSPKTALIVVGSFLGVLMLLAGAYFVGHQSGAAVPGLTGTPTAGPSDSAAPLDQAKVSALMAKIAANPKDAASYLALGDLYFNAKDYTNAEAFYKKVTVITPANDQAWVAVGASAYNLGDAKTAETAWKKAIALNAKNAEAHYDLGFLYLAAQPSETAKAKAEWQKVIDIDPSSDIANTVKTHMPSLDAKSTATPKPSAS